MYGLLIAATILIVKLSLGIVLWQTAFIEISQFLFWWYIGSGVLAVGLAVLAWAGDLGTEGARMRHGIASNIGWIIGLSKVPLTHVTPVLYLALRRGLFIFGAYLLTQGVQAVGATFSQDDLSILLGAFCLAGSLLGGLATPQFRRIDYRYPAQQA
jgi:hypothetical protein